MSQIERCPSCRIALRPWNLAKWRGQSVCSTCRKSLETDESIQREMRAETRRDTPYEREP